MVQTACWCCAGWGARHMMVRCCSPGADDGGGGGAEHVPGSGRAAVGA